MESFDLQAVVLALPILLVSLTAHEFGHAWVALKQGDDTAYMQGRVTMNPAAHVDWIGTILFPALAIGSGMPLLGWARPVPTNPRKFRSYRRGDILVSLAGVAANAVLAIVFALALWILSAAVPAGGTVPETAVTAGRMFFYGIFANIGLIIFNLLPIPPLDGSRVLYHYLPARAAAEYRKLYQYGFIILWILVLTGALRFMAPVIWHPTRLLLEPAVSANPMLVVTVLQSL
ncbi:MAG TPA: site-2 protease family protein [Longimicrobium sp.]|jgi:Zn-dependent protease|uniref:site-2 protease family protein n=1 Tax=Longimicrobium sp. TaxID=2029185 RepID=UPI002EDA8518